MEPGHEDREYYAPIIYMAGWGAASMEPGHEDREYVVWGDGDADAGDGPQWSPVMKTGNTAPVLRDLHRRHAPQWSPVMKTGNTGCWQPSASSSPGLNGARS